MRTSLAALAADPAALLLVVAIVLVVVILLGVALAAWRRRRDDHRETVAPPPAPAPESPDPVAMARWVDEGRQLFNVWQERVERLDELQGRLAAMAQEIGQLKVQTVRMDELRADNLRLGQEAEAFRLERDQLQAVLARISELVRQASEGRPGDAGEAPPATGP